MQPEQPVFEFNPAGLTPTEFDPVLKQYGAGAPDEVVRERIELLEARLTVLRDKLLRGDPDAVPLLREAAHILNDLVHFPQIGYTAEHERLLAGVKAVVAAAPNEGTAISMQRSLELAVGSYEKLDAFALHTRRHATAWFQSHLPNQAPGEWTKLLFITAAPVAASVERYAARTHEPPTAPATTIEHEVVTTIGQTPIPGSMLTQESVATHLTGHLKLSNERTFNTEYYRHRIELTQRRKGGSLTEWYDDAWSMVTEVDTVLGFCDRKQMVLRDRGSDVPAGIHEAMHMLANRMWCNEFNNCLDEGVTEYFSRLVCSQRYPNHQPKHYETNFKLVTTMLHAGRLGQDDLVRAYFVGDVLPVQAAIKELSGGEGLRLLTERTTEPDRVTCQNWEKQFMAHHKPKG
jgi:hypothetical protein